MDLPRTYTDKNETNCCPVPNIEDWDEKEIIFRNKPFIRMYTKNFLHVPLNMSKVMKVLFDTVESANASLPTDQSMILSRDVSPWKSEQLYAVKQPIDGADNVLLSGKFLTKVFEGPYSDAKSWYQQMIELAHKTDANVLGVYFFYTTCPKCAKHYGKNYSIGLVKVAEVAS